MVRKIIEIDEAKCNGCGLCAEACHEGAIGMVDGKARLLRDDYCDGLGDCLPACPVDAIHFVQREAAAYDAKAVAASMAAKEAPAAPAAHAAPGHSHAGGCPGAMAKKLAPAAPAGAMPIARASALGQWPVQIKLAPLNAPYFAGAHLLVAADCAAYAYAAFHQDFMQDKITLIGCPKLDDTDYSEKLGAILRQNDVQSVTVVRMEVPCCGGIQHAATESVKASGKEIPLKVFTLSTEGHLLPV